MPMPAFPPVTSTTVICATLSLGRSRSAANFGAADNFGSSTFAPHILVARGPPRASLLPTTSAANLSPRNDRRRLTPHAARTARPHRPPGLAPVPRHHDLRPPVRRGDVARRSSTPPPTPASRSSTPPTSTRSAAALEHVGPHRGDRRPLARGQARSASSSPPSASGRMGRSRWDQGNSRKHILDADRRVAAPARHRLRRPVPAALRRPGRRRSTRRSRRSTTSSGRARCATSGCSNFLAYRLARAIGRSEAARPRALRLGAAPLQPAVPPDRARAAAAVRGGGHRGDPLQPARRRAAHRQARPRRRRRRRAPGSRSAAAGPMYQDRYWHDREFDTVDELRRARRRRGHVADHAGGGVGAGATRRSPRPSSARAGPSSSPTTSLRSTHRSTPSSRHSSTSSPPSSGEATRRGDATGRRSQLGTSPRRRARDRPHHRGGRSVRVTAARRLRRRCHQDRSADAATFRATSAPASTTTWVRCTSTSTAGSAASCSTSRPTTDGAH